MLHQNLLLHFVTYKHQLSLITFTNPYVNIRITYQYKDTKKNFMHRCVQFFFASFRTNSKKRRTLRTRVFLRKEKARRAFGSPKSADRDVICSIASLHLEHFRGKSILDLVISEKEEEIGIFLQHETDR